MINRIANNIKRLRNNKGYSQIKLSNVSNVSISLIKDLERRKYNNPSVLTLNKIARALEVDIKELF